MKTFVDTSAWIALRQPKDRHHASVKAWFGASHGGLTTTSDVVSETVTLAQARWGHATAYDLGTALLASQNLHVVHVNEDFFQLAWERFQARKDKGYSFTDCSSFVIMERMDIKQAVTLDRHFAQEGFEVVPYAR